MKENANIGNFNKVLVKYRFVDPAPEEVRRHVRLNKEKQFRKTLKRAGGYSLIFVLISHIYFTLKKYGIGITIVRSAVILGFLSLLTAAVFTTCLYWLILRKSPESILSKEIDNAIGVIIEKPGATTEPAEKLIVEPPAVIEDRIGVQPFHGENCPVRQALSASDRLAGTLASLRGVERVVNLRLGRSGRKSGMMLLGTIESREGAYAITARVVSVKDSRILFYDSEIAGSEYEIEPACDRLSRKIFDRIK